MRVRSPAIAAMLFVFAPANAQSSDRAAQNSTNWDVFLKFYPKRAIAAREEGLVGFRVTLDSKGDVKDCEVTHSSGHALLDQETCNIITLHAVFKPDSGLAPSQVRTSDGVIAWKLPSSTVPLQAPSPVRDASDLDKVVCKKSVRTGSLADVQRTCMTVREWARQSDDTQAAWDELQGRKGSTKGN